MQDLLAIQVELIMMQTVITRAHTHQEATFGELWFSLTQARISLKNNQTESLELTVFYCSLSQHVGAIDTHCTHSSQLIWFHLQCKVLT